MCKTAKKIHLKDTWLLMRQTHTQIMYYTQTHTLYVYIHTSRCQKKKFKPVTLIRSHTHPHLQIN